MAIRKRILRSGEIRWQVIWRSGTKCATEMFDSYRDAKEKAHTIEGAKPTSTSASTFRMLAKQYLDYETTLVETGQHERSYLAMLKGHINNHILNDLTFADQRCCEIGTPEVQLFFNRLITRIPAKSAKKIRTTLSQIFVFGAQVGFVVGNPARDAKIKVKRRPDAGVNASFVLPGKNALRALRWRRFVGQDLRLLRLSSAPWLNDVCTPSA